MAAATVQTTKNIPWVERYRPKSLDQVSHQEEVVATLQNAVKTGQLPHLLLVRNTIFLAPSVLYFCYLTGI